MTAEAKCISKKALLLHEESIAAFGGARGIRNAGLLDSALARPENPQAYGPESTPADLATYYALGLARNHAFVDGNKRACLPLHRLIPRDQWLSFGGGSGSRHSGDACGCGW